MLKALFSEDILHFLKFVAALGEIFYFDQAFLDEDLYEVIGLAQRKIKITGQLSLRKVFPGR